ncbi:hypothetical protein Fmac_011637 [Flemingia macrophylla]|uniref:Uncharacterized protein n=1 Tax=Flemingia macrophylla TaxID=520843 RepID=A0ABD1MMZ8_9FABA
MRRHYIMTSRTPKGYMIALLNRKVMMPMDMTRSHYSRSPATCIYSSRNFNFTDYLNPVWNEYHLNIHQEAKLKELLHRLTSPEIKLCSDAAKEFARLLKSETGGDLLREYVHGSPNCSELLEALKLRKDQKGMHYVFDLISVILSHGEVPADPIGVPTRKTTHACSNE